MRSSAGSSKQRLRALLWLGAVPLAALAVSLLLALGYATLPRPVVRRNVAPITIPEPRFGPQSASATARTAQPQDLWSLLAPGAYVVDAIALAGLAAVLAVRYAARRRRVRP